MLLDILTVALRTTVHVDLMDDFHMHSIDTAILRDVTSSLSGVAVTIIDHGVKPSNNVRYGEEGR